MAKQEIPFEAFLNDVPPDDAGRAAHLHRILDGRGCDVKLKPAARGHVVSYNDPAREKILANIVTRKKGLLVRIYGACAGQYEAFLATLPEYLLQLIDKAPACKRLLNPADCSPTCPTGYIFSIGDKSYQNCRYNCFLFPLTDDTLPVIENFLQQELDARAADH